MTDHSEIIEMAKLVLERQRSTIDRVALWSPKQARILFVMTDSFEQVDDSEEGRVIARRISDKKGGWLHYDDSGEMRVYTKFLPFNPDLLPVESMVRRHKKELRTGAKT